MQPEIIVAFLIGSFSALLGSFINNLLTKDRDMQREFNRAAADFQNIFEGIKATIHLYPDLTGSQIADQILKTNYTEQRIAFGSLSRQMWCIKRRAFTKTWQKYENPEAYGTDPFLSYSGAPWEVGKSFDREYILKAIDHLISFANK